LRALKGLLLFLPAQASAGLKFWCPKDAQQWRFLFKEGAAINCSPWRCADRANDRGDAQGPP
jgi:hypothetical protein